MMNEKKKLTAAAAAYILGLSPDVKIRGTKEQTSSLREVLGASQKLYVLLRDHPSDSGLSEVLESKSVAAQKFEKSFGYIWPF
jgi:hypothetical protein